MNQRLYKFSIFSFLNKFALYTPFIGLFLKTYVSASSSQILLVFSLYSFCVFLFEIPSGFISDRFGEKKSIILSSVLLSVSTVFLCLGHYSFFLLGEAVLALSHSLFSGSFDSFLYKISRDKNYDYNSLLSKTNSMEWLSIALASILGFFIAKFDLKYVFYITFVTNVISIIWVFKLPHANKSSDVSALNILKSFSQDFFKNTSLRFWMISSVLFYTLIISGYFLLQTFLNEHGWASEKNGLLYFLITFFAFFSSRSYSFLVEIKLFKDKFLTQIIILFLLALNFVLLAVSINFIFSIILFCTFRMLWGFATPFFTSILNKSITNDSARSSLLSLNSLLSNGFQAIMLLLLSRFTSRKGFFILTLFIILLIGILLAMEFNKQRIIKKQSLINV